MYYTLGQVKDALKGTTNAYTSGDLTRDINRAITGLAGLSGWQCLRRTVRLFSAGPVFALPQGYAGLVRACVNGRPATLRAQDFRFLQSGPGDLRRPPPGFVSVNIRNIMDVGLSPVIYEPTHPFKLVAFTDATSKSSDTKPSPISVVGTRPDGRTVRIDVPVYYHAEYDSTGGLIDGSAEIDSAEPADVILSRVENVVVPDDATDYLSLYAINICDPEHPYQIACYNPLIKVPRFRRYEIGGLPLVAPVEILAETRIDPIPLVHDSDVIPFESPIEPIEWMLRADWQMKSGEVTQAQNYRNQAMAWLKSHEVVDDTKQTQVVINSVYNGSMGELSDEAENI